MDRVNLEQLLSSVPDLRTEDVTVNDWGGLVTVAETDAIERIGLLQLYERMAGDDNKLEGAKSIQFACCLISKSIVDESGARMLDSRQGRAAIQQLSFENAADLERLCQAAMRVNYLSQADDVQADAKKNSANPTINSRSVCAAN